MESLRVAVCHDQPLWCKLRIIPLRLSHLLSCNRSASHPMLPFPRFLCKWISQEGQWCLLTPWLPPGVSPSQSKDMQITQAAGYSTWPRGLNIIYFCFCLLVGHWKHFLKGFPTICWNTLLLLWINNEYIVVMYCLVHLQCQLPPNGQ